MDLKEINSVFNDLHEPKQKEEVVKKPRGRPPKKIEDFPPITKTVKAPSTPEPDVRPKLINSINSYYNLFPDLKNTSKLIINEKTSNKVLEDEVARCQEMLKVMNAFESCKRLDLLLNKIVGIVGSQYFGLPLQGLGIHAEETQSMVLEELKELSIKYQDFFCLSPESRYLMKFVQRVVAVMQLSESESQSSVDYDEISKKYQDL